MAHASLNIHPGCSTAAHTRSSTLLRCAYAACKCACAALPGLHTHAAGLMQQRSRGAATLQGSSNTVGPVHYANP